MARKYTSGPFSPGSGPFSGLTFPSYRQYLNAKAQLRGYASESARARGVQPPTSQSEPTILHRQRELDSFQERHYQVLMNRGNYSSVFEAYDSADAEHFRDLLEQRDEARSLGDEDSAENLDKRAWSYLYSGEERTDFDWGDTPGKE